MLWSIFKSAAGSIRFALEYTQTPFQAFLPLRPPNTFFPEDHPRKSLAFPDGQPGSCRLSGELRKVYRIVRSPLVVRVDGSLGTHKTDISIPGDNGGHSFIRPKSGYKFQVNSLLSKIPFLNGYILWSVENRVGHLIECDFCQLSVLCSRPACRRRGREPVRRQDTFFINILLFASGILYDISAKRCKKDWPSPVQRKEKKCM